MRSKLVATAGVWLLTGAALVAADFWVEKDFTLRNPGDRGPTDPDDEACRRTASRPGFVDGRRPSDRCSQARDQADRLRGESPG